jgi:hypothetical protein
MREAPVTLPFLLLQHQYICTPVHSMSITRELSSFLDGANKSKSSCKLAGINETSACHFCNSHFLVDLDPHDLEKSPLHTLPKHASGIPYTTSAVPTGNAPIPLKYHVLNKLHN